MAQPRRRPVQDDEPLLCVTGCFTGVACFDPKTLRLNKEIPTPKGYIRRVISIPPEDGREEELIAVGEHVGGLRQEVLLYHPHQGASPIRRLSASHSRSVWGLAYVSPRIVVSGSYSGGTELVVSDVNGGDKVMDLKDAPKYTTRITTSTIRPQDGRGMPERRRGNGFVFVGGGDYRGDNSIRHYDLRRSERANEVDQEFEDENYWAFGLGYSTEKNLLFSSSPEKTLRIWSVQDGMCLQKLQLSSDSYSLLFDPKKRFIFCGIRGGIIEVWDYRQTRRRVRKFNHPTEETHLFISDITQIDDETYASIGDEDHSVITWTDRGKVLATAKTRGSNSDMCFVGGSHSPVVAAQQEERIVFLLSFPSVFWGVQVRGRRCGFAMTPAMMHLD